MLRLMCEETATRTQTRDNGIVRICTRLGIPVLGVNNCTNSERLLFGLSVCCRRSGTDIGGRARVVSRLIVRCKSPPLPVSYLNLSISLTSALDFHSAISEDVLMITRLKRSLNAPDEPDTVRRVES